MKYINQTDVSMIGIENQLEDFKVLLLKGQNDTNDSTSLSSISDELKIINKNIENLANTSINGEYIFSGNKINTKPIKNGIYFGNDKKIEVFISDGLKETKNLNGKELFVDTEMFKILNDSINAIDLNNEINIETSINNLDKLIKNVQFLHSKVGANGKSFKNNIERTNLLKISSENLKSNTIDIDYASKIAELNNLTTNYNAMAYALNKTSKLSLVNILN